MYTHTLIFNFLDFNTNLFNQSNANININQKTISQLLTQQLLNQSHLFNLNQEINPYRPVRGQTGPKAIDSRHNPMKRDINLIGVCMHQYTTKQNRLFIRFVRFVKK